MYKVIVSLVDIVDSESLKRVVFKTNPKPLHADVNTLTNTALSGITGEMR